LRKTTPYIIAEIGSVHDGSLGNAKKLIELAKSVGADCVKFQMHISEFETTPDAPNPTFFSEEPRFSYFDRTSFSIDQWNELIIHAKNQKIDFLISPFNIEAVRIMRTIGLNDFKVPSGELSNIQMLKEISRNFNKVYLSTGMSDMNEIETALKVFGNQTNGVTVMQCTSIYPCPVEKVGINVLEDLVKKYDLTIGFSDHTRGLAAAIMAVTLGATIIEKHLTFSRAMYGSDAWNALEPIEFKQFCEEIRNSSIILQSPVDKNDLSEFRQTSQTFKKGIYTRKSLSKNHQIKDEDLIMLKPLIGIPASEINNVIGKTLNIDLEAQRAIKYQDLR